MRNRAVFTIVQDEPRFLPLWVRYYRRYFASGDVYVLDHDTRDGSTRAVAGDCHVLPVHRDRSFDHHWLRATVEAFQAFLLRSYENVLFAEADELVTADPRLFSGLDAYVEALQEKAVRCRGFNVVHLLDQEPTLDWNAPILGQRKWWRSSLVYSKPILAKRPLSWIPGFHDLSAGEAVGDPALLLVHLHRVDYGYCLSRHQSRVARVWNEADLLAGAGRHSRVVDPEEFHVWFFQKKAEGDGDLERIPDHFRGAL